MPVQKLGLVSWKQYKAAKYFDLKCWIYWRHFVSLFNNRNLKIQERVQLSSCPLRIEGSSSLTQPQRYLIHHSVYFCMCEEGGLLRALLIFKRWSLHLIDSVSIAKHLIPVCQTIVAEHEIRNISCAAQDPDDLCTFAYITKDLKSGHHFCHVFSTVEVVSEVNSSIYP